MEIPLGLNTKTNPTSICNLKKSLYGLNNFQELGLTNLQRAMKKLNYSQCQVDHTHFLKCSPKRKKVHSHLLC